MKTHKFRLYPDRKAEMKMLDTLELCRRAYNEMLGMLNEQEVIDKAQIQGIIPDMKICDKRYKQLYSKTMQYECYRLFSNLSALRQTKKKNRKVGSLRFKGKGWFKTFTYNQSGFKIINTGKRHQILKLSKIADIPIRCHREIKGKIKQVTVKKEASGKWYAFIAIESSAFGVPKQRVLSTEQTDKEIVPIRKVEKVVGIDVGLDNLVYDSDGNAVKNPRHLNKYKERLAKLQRKMSKKKKGSINKNKERIKVARLHEKIVNTRNDFLHKLSHYYVDNYDAIGMEDMPMGLNNNIFAKSKADASWGKFRQFIAYKAESAGKLFVPVPYRGTTQRCSQCGKIVRKELWDREHNCPCGFSAPRDYNSALEIKRLCLKKIVLENPRFSARQNAKHFVCKKFAPNFFAPRDKVSMGQELPESTPAKMEAIPVMATSVVEAGSPTIYGWGSSLRNMLTKAEYCAAV